jgi:hypothetical protein
MHIFLIIIVIIYAIYAIFPNSQSTKTRHYDASGKLLGYTTEDK